MEKFYIFEEYSDGGNLDNQFGRWKTPAKKRLTIARAILKPVVMMHQSGLYHRDLKPENYLMCKDGIKLCDYEGVTELEKDPHQLGTSGYIPKTRGMRVSRHQDEYAMGVMIYRLFNHGAFPPSNFSKLADKAIQKGKTDPTAIALQLMHPDDNKRLSVNTALDLINQQTSA